MRPPDIDSDRDSLSIEVLRPDAIDQLRLGWWSRIDPDGVARILMQAPGVSVWDPQSHEYALVGPWRHRSDVMHVIDLVAVRAPIELLRAAIDQAQVAGVRLLIWIEMSERRNPTFYERAGMQLLETVISYESIAGGSRTPPVRSGRIERVDTLDEELLAELISVDWNAFPFLWRNSDDEFHDYFTQPGVEVYLLRDDDSAVGYLGITVFPGWGHIDRLAVSRTAQGRGRGKHLTEFALQRLASLGATRVGLSTQHRNRRSQSLYANLGFRRQVSGDYRIYGRALWQNDSIEDLVMDIGE